MYHTVSYGTYRSLPSFTIHVCTRLREAYHALATVAYAIFEWMWGLGAVLTGAPNLVLVPGPEIEFLLTNH